MAWFRLQSYIKKWHNGARGIFFLSICSYAIPTVILVPLVMAFFTENKISHNWILEKGLMWHLHLLVNQEDLQLCRRNERKRLKSPIVHRMEERDEFIDNDTTDWVDHQNSKALTTQSNFRSMNLQSTCST